MPIEFDPEKDRINRGKHGISLARADVIDIETAFIEADERFIYGEKRFRAWGLIDDRLHILVFTMRGETLRAISLRRANEREKVIYAKS